MFILTKYENSIWLRLLAPLLAAMLVSAVYHSGAQAEAAHPTYIISDQDGYGMLDCLTQKAECGRIVADAWCEAHGHGPAHAFGRADDVTATIAKDAPRPAEKPGSAVVACAE